MVNFMYDCKKCQNRRHCQIYKDTLNTEKFLIRKKGPEMKAVKKPKEIHIDILVNCDNYMPPSFNRKVD